MTVTKTFYLILGILLFQTLSLRLHAELPDTASCKLFQKDVLSPEQKGNLKTDTFAISKNGKLLFDWYDGSYKPESPHCLWSGSKTVTAAILGAEIQKGLLKLDDLVTNFIPTDERRAALMGKNPNLTKNQLDDDENLFRTLKVRDLVTMSSGFTWKESYESGNVDESSVIHMLYLDGAKDMGLFSLSSSFSQMGPGKIWNYSSGDTNLLMTVLARAAKGDAYFPWTYLFKPMGLNSAIFEKDSAGNYIGAAYAYLSTLDFLKLGQLYLAGGQWDKNGILPPGWVDFTKTPAPAQLSDNTPLHSIQADGAGYGGGVWLNQEIRGLPAPMPDISQKVFFAAGHYGQVLLIFPEENIVVARTGHDGEYWSKLPLISRRVRDCFMPPATTEAFIPKPLAPSPKFEYKQILFAVKAGLLASTLAKNHCSCLFVAGLPFDKCKQRSNLPQTANYLFDVDYSTAQGSTRLVTVRPNWLAKVIGYPHAPAAKAVYDTQNPQNGCQLQ